MWHAVRAFFDNGGARLYVKRVYRGIPIGPAPDGDEEDTRELRCRRATAVIGRTPPEDGEEPTEDGLRIAARYPGVVGARRARFTLELGQDALTSVEGTASRSTGQGRRSTARSCSWSRRAADGVRARTSERQPDELHHLVVRAGGHRGRRRRAGALLADLRPGRDHVSVVTLAITDLPTDGDAGRPRLGGLPLDPEHERAGVRDSVFDGSPTIRRRRADALDIPIAIEPRRIADGAPGRCDAALPSRPGAHATLRSELWLATRLASRATPIDRSFMVELTGGIDGDPSGRGRLPGPCGSRLGRQARASSRSRTSRTSRSSPRPGSTHGYERRRPAAERGRDRSTR